jgi:hypothetical protein
MSEHLKIPQTLNGYPVIAAIPVHRLEGLLAVIVHRAGHPVHEYLTAIWSLRCGDTWDSGFYVETLDEAIASLIERAVGLDFAARKLARAINEGAKS